MRWLRVTVILLSLAWVCPAPPSRLFPDDNSDSDEFPSNDQEGARFSSRFDRSGGTENDEVSSSHEKEGESPIVQEEPAGESNELPFDSTSTSYETRAQSTQRDDAENEVPSTLTPISPISSTPYSTTSDNSTLFSEGSAERATSPLDLAGTEESSSSIEEDDESLSGASSDGEFLHSTGPQSTAELEEVPEAEVQPVPSRGNSPHAMPSSADHKPSAESGSGSNSTASLDGLSASELKLKVDEAKRKWDEAKNATETLRGELGRKNEELKGPKRDYEEKKKKWEELEKIAEEKETAEREYNTAFRALKQLKKDFTKAEKAYLKKKGELEDAEKEKLEIPKWPGLLQTATDAKTLKEGEISTVDGKIHGMDADIESAKDKWTDAEKKVNQTLESFNLAQCDKSANAGSRKCTGYKDLLKTQRDDANREQEKYNKSVEALQAAEVKLEGLKNETLQLENEINGLQTKISTRTLAKIDEKIEKLNEELTPLKTTFDEISEKKTDAENDLETKRVAKEAAEENGGSQVARHNAIEAQIEFIDANTTKTAIDGQIRECEIALEKAKESEKTAESNFKLLENKYEAAAKREKEKPESSSMTWWIVGGVIVLFLILGGIIGYVVYRKYAQKRNKKVKNRCPSADKKGQEGAGLTQDNIEDAGTPIPKSSTPATSTPSKGAGTQRSVSQTEHEGEQKKQDNPSQQPQMKDEKNETPEGLPDLATVPFIPGEEPFKIPAKNFKWRGPMRRRTRWHGAPDHDYDGKKKAVESVDKIWFDPNANYATEIGPNEIIEDGGPASDSNRSEWLNNLQEWEQKHNELVAQQAAEAAAKGGQSEGQEADVKADEKAEKKKADEKQQEEKKQEKKKADEKKPSPDTEENKKSPKGSKKSGDRRSVRPAKSASKQTPRASSKDKKEKKKESRTPKSDGKKDETKNLLD